MFLNSESNNGPTSFSFYRSSRLVVAPLDGKGEAENPVNTDVTVFLNWLNVLFIVVLKSSVLSNPELFGIMPPVDP